MAIDRGRYCDDHSNHLFIRTLTITVVTIETIVGTMQEDKKITIKFSPNDSKELKALAVILN
ncbi:hypothetical protein [Lentilactobacillus buchneri]|uniref:hypothetical protein n=1 Tax=Lentilactobacillus buchneri TaxID=1581 RepID=UPI00145F9532|nr:hypothetical protein [Lentilactobacillus buchneri]